MTPITYIKSVSKKKPPIDRIKRQSTPEPPSAKRPTTKRPVKHPRNECTQNLVLFQNLQKEMKELKRFTKSTERKFEELEMALQNISGEKNANYNNNENSPLLLEILKNRISSLEKHLEKDAIINFLLKQKSETNNNTSSVNKTVTENNEISETERGNSSPNSNLKQKKKKLKQNV